MRTICLILLLFCCGPSQAKGEKAKDFFAKGPDLELGQAIERHDQAQTRRLLSKGSKIDLNVLHKKDMTFLHFALCHSNATALGILVGEGADPQIVVEGIGSAFDVAVRAKDAKFLEALLKAGADPNAKDEYDMPYFFAAAARNDRLKTLVVFTDYGADFDIPSPSGRTAAMHAMASLAYDQVEYLIRHGIDVHSQTTTGVTLARFVELEFEQQEVDKSTAAYQKLVELRTLLQDRGVTFR